MKKIFILLSLLMFSFMVYAEVTGTLNFTCAGCLYGETYSTVPQQTQTNQTEQNETTTTVQTTTTTTLNETTTTLNETTTTINQTTTTTITTSETETIIIAPGFTRDELKNFIKDEKLSEKIQNLVGKFNIDKIAKESEKIQKDLNIEKVFIVSNNVTTVLVMIDYSGSAILKNFMVYEIVPKEFTKSASDIIISTNMDYVVVHEDPSFLFYVPEMGKTKKSITYKVNKVVDESLFNKTQTIVLVKYVKEGVSVIIWIIVGVIIIGGILAFIFRDKIIEYYQIKSYVRKGLKKRSFIDELKEKIDEIISKIKGEKKKKFVFKYKVRKK